MKSLSNSASTLLPSRFGTWFADRGWQPRPHQLALLETVSRGESALLVAPTGGGKTLAGFLPSLVDLAGQVNDSPAGRLHTLYISPLKALAVDVARNLETPIREMGLPITVETRTGDTPAHRRQRQRAQPPDILLTTPEQLALLLAYRDSAKFFRHLHSVILDELHAIDNTKRGELLALGLARLSRIAPTSRRIGLSATVHDPERLRRFLVPQPPGETVLSALVQGQGGAVPDVQVLASEADIPWSGHTGRHAMAEVYEAIKSAGVSLLFVNTRSQAELVFQTLWRINDDNLPIALHHGSLEGGQRRKVETAMADGRLRAVVCTSTLDLGIDWGAVDLVIHLGAPKGASRLLQRIGRANHRLDEPSRALLVPSNRFEVLECRAAQEAAIRSVLDGAPPRTGGLDVLAQHVMGMACAEPFSLTGLYEEVASAAPYAALDYETFEQVVDFVATGGYALRRYDRFRRIRKDRDGLFQVTNARVAQAYRMNVGTIVEAPMMKVRLTRTVGGRKGPDGKPGRRPGGRAGRVLGEIEEWMVEQLRPGDTFLFAGEVLRFEGLQDTEVLVTRASGEDPMVPSWQGGKFPLSTYLADRVREMISVPDQWSALPMPVQDWLGLQRKRSVLPGREEMLVETFPRGGKHYLVAYPFEGRLAHQTLGMLLTRRLERADLHPLGFVANDYALAVWSLRGADDLDMDALFHEDMLGDDLDAWMAESALLKRMFRQCAVIAGLIETRHPGQEKTGRQVTFSTDLIYDVLRAHEPDHVLLKAAWADASAGLLDIGRLGDMLQRIKGRIVHQSLKRVSPLAVPVMLEVGREPVYGAASEALLDEAADDLIEEATRLD
ncbi:MAG: ligase-associated DNA damage response DEXH box helicase [Alphaproteobacteria bacterium]